MLKETIADVLKNKNSVYYNDNSVVLRFSVVELSSRAQLPFLIRH